jgi:hypothetical protein
LGLFVITNATVLLGRLVYLVYHQPSSPSYLVAWFILLLSPMPPSYLVTWFILFVINQAHLHIWLFGLSYLLSTNFTIIFGCSQYFQQGWTHQCRYI